MRGAGLRLVDRYERSEDGQRLPFWVRLVRAPTVTLNQLLGGMARRMRPVARGGDGAAWRERAIRARALLERFKQDREQLVAQIHHLRAAAADALFIVIRCPACMRSSTCCRPGRPRSAPLLASSGPGG
jgi:hypothetical protein